MEVGALVDPDEVQITAVREVQVSAADELA
jgi:hypothetical protein